MSCVPNMEATYFECWLRLPPSHLGKVQGELDIALGLVSVLHIRRRQGRRPVQWLSEEDPEDSAK